MKNMNHQKPFSDGLGDDDVLLGRGTGPNDHIGNERFRNVVLEVLQTPNLAGKKQSRLEGKQKSELALKVLKAVAAKGGRFVKKYPIKNHKGRQKCKKNVYVEVPVQVAVEKTKQTIRYMLDTKKHISCTADCAKFSLPSSKTNENVKYGTKKSGTNEKKPAMSSVQDSALTLLKSTKDGCSNPNRKQRASMVSSKKPPNPNSPCSGTSENIVSHMPTRSEGYQFHTDGGNELAPRILPSDTAGFGRSSPDVRWSSYALDEALRVLDSYSAVSRQPFLLSNKPTLLDLIGGLARRPGNSGADPQDPRISLSVYPQPLAPSYSPAVMQSTSGACSFNVPLFQHHGMAGTTSLSAMVPSAPPIGRTSLLDIAVKLHQEQTAQYFPVATRNNGLFHQYRGAF